MATAPDPQTRPSRIPYSNGKKTKEQKDRFLRNNPERLYYDENKKEEITNLIFYTGRHAAWIKIIKTRYEGKGRGIKDGYQLTTKDGNINVYTTGTIMVQGGTEMFKIFQSDFETLKAEIMKDNAQTSNGDDLAAQFDQLIVEESPSKMKDDEKKEEAKEVYQGIIEKEENEKSEKKIRSNKKKMKD